MERWARWVVAIIVTAGIIALVAFARGTPEHAEPTAPAAAVVTVPA